MRRYRLRVPAGEAEPALVRMLDLFPGGVEEERDGDDVVLAGYADEAPADGLESEDVEPGWEDRWRAYHRAVTVGRIWVGPPWAADRPEPDAEGRVAVVIDPGRAFGTGGHGSTRAALELLQRLAPCPALDLGCGSGVLAIAAAKLGFAPVSAVDAERAALDATRANAIANGLSPEPEGSDPSTRGAAIAIERADLRNAPAPRADVVAANLMRPLLLRVAEQWAGELPPALIISGLLDHEAGEVAAALAPLREQRRLSRHGWSALLLTRA